jgi:predicted DNA-binding transcriptional regulator YafY
VRRADRLFQILQLLRGRRRAVTALELAEKLEVSPRTVYRDVRDLIANGTPIEGEAGVGYRLRHFDLPPLMFDADEVEALVLGARAVEAFGDAGLAKAAASVLSKVEAVLPDELRRRLAGSALFALRHDVGRSSSEGLRGARIAIAERRKLRFAYERADGETSKRVVRPLGAFFWGRAWTLTAWCELRHGFRNFRIDRMSTVEILEETFEDEPGQTLRDFLAEMGPEAEQILGD